MIDLKDEILTLTKQLVSIPSVNTTGEGEKNIACFMEDYLRSIPYFAEHPDRVIIQPLRDDPLGRRNVFAWITGEKCACADAILLHGHMDTVGVEDFGALAPFAFNPDELMQRLRQADLPQEVRADLESGDYLFGRGACDMKGGDAVFLALARYLCGRIDAFGGHLVLSFNPVEENLHTGIIEGLDVIQRLQKQGLRFQFAINNDYICPLYPGDTTRSIYSGAAGKLLPCFYIIGRETHVGQCFEGFDASQTAAELVSRINLNCDFCDTYCGESTLPPTVLKIKDLKPEYNVQTSCASFVYFNYFVHNQTIDQISGKLLQAAQASLDAVAKHSNEEYQRFCTLTGVDYLPMEYDTQALLYDQLFERAQKAYSGDLSALVRQKAARLQQEGTELREAALAIVQELCGILNIKKPTVVLFFAAPYCPHNTLHPEDPAQSALYSKLEQILQSFEQQFEEKFRFLHFFQSLSDSSYLALDDDEPSIRKLINNFPAYQTLYPVPLEQIKAVNIPGINYGCFGKDAHKWTERVYVPYSFGMLPNLILRTIQSTLIF